MSRTSRAATIDDSLGRESEAITGAFQVAEQVHRSGAPFADELNGHSSFVRLVSDGYQVITY